MQPELPLRIRMVQIGFAMALKAVQQCVGVLHSLILQSIILYIRSFFTTTVTERRSIPHCPNDSIQPSRRPLRPLSAILTIDT